VDEEEMWEMLEGATSEDMMAIDRAFLRHVLKLGQESTPSARTELAIIESTIFDEEENE